MARRNRPTGVLEHGTGEEGSSRNLGELGVSVGNGGTATRSNTKRSGMDCRAVLAAHSTDEAGIGAQPTPWREGE